MSLIMNTIVTNEWIWAGTKKPPKGREVLVAFSDGSKMVLKWVGMYWSDPRTGIRQMFTPGHHPEWWYMFEKLEIDGRC